MAKKKAALREFIFEGTVELRGVQFFVVAEDEMDARAKASAGEWTDYDTLGAETVNWELDLKTIQAND